MLPEPGDIVGFLDEEGRGTVISVDKNTVVVRTEFGIDIPYPVRKIVIYKKAAVKKEASKPAREKKTEGELPKKKSTTKSAKKNTGKKKDVVQDNFDWTDDRKIKKVYDPFFKAPLKKEEKPSQKKSVSSLRDTWEIDLHIHELIDEWRSLSNAEMVEIQMKYLMAFLDKAFTARVPRVIIIHGVGKGVLRDEVRHYLDRFTHIQYFDASYSEYGTGATEARITYGKL